MERMPRQARLVFPGVALHVRHRANNGSPCFLREGDYLVYLVLLQQASAKFRCAIHAYCLMTNHVHLLVTPDDASGCGAMMHAVAQRYAHYFNIGNDRTGSLWEGRFRSCLVESAHYIITCYRYIELNPVRARMVSQPEAYPWSSFAGNSGMRRDALLTPHAEYAALSAHAYREIVADGLQPSALVAVRDAIDGGLPLVSLEFKARLEQLAGRKLVRGKAGRPPKSPEREKSVNVPDF